MLTRVPRAEPPVVAHLIYQLSTGGMESNLIRLINFTPAQRYRHVVLCMAGFSEWAGKVQAAGAEIVDLKEPAGFRPSTYLRLTSLLRKTRPSILHTRNLGSIEGQLCGWLAGVPARIHGEHGRDVLDPRGANPKYNLIRRLLRPCTHHFTAVSRDLSGWLVNTIQVPPARVTQIYNGVDTALYHPRTQRPELPGMPNGFLSGASFVIGSVGRMQVIKNQTLLARGFLELRARLPETAGLRLVLVGSGPLTAECRSILDAGGAGADVWLPGERADIAGLMQAFDLFVLPSLAEGVSNTILEAMASGLPVVATNVGGNPELVRQDVTGLLVEPVEGELSGAMARYVLDRGLCARHGREGRRAAEAEFSIEAMVERYLSTYDQVLALSRRR